MRRRTPHFTSGGALFWREDGDRGHPDAAGDGRPAARGGAPDAAYWLAHASLVASETYTQFEDTFPLADGWLDLCLVAASYCLLTARRAALLWLLAGGRAGL